MNQVDPVQFGELRATVESHTEKLEEIGRDVKLLLAKDHQAHGLWTAVRYAGLAAGCLLSGSAGGVIIKLMEFGK